MGESRWDQKSEVGSRGFLAENSLSIALFSLFTMFLVAQAVFGWHSYNESLTAENIHAISFRAYLKTGTFLNGIFSNWQAAILQLTVLIAFSTVLRQRGAAHSRKGDDEPRKGETSSKSDIGGDIKRGAPAPESRRRLQANVDVNRFHGNWLYDNSLSLAMFFLFILFFAAHSLTSHIAYNEEQSLRHLAPEAFGKFLASSTFFFNTAQTWEAEFFAIGVYIVLSIYLRQVRSPESKKVGSDDSDTGDTNE